jgi:hypothetical protein|nr:MAG TPA: hypothetical protein [Caudoviricetes sp.]
MKVIRFFLAVVAGLMIVNDNPAAQDFRINFWGLVLAVVLIATTKRGEAGIKKYLKTE